MFLLAFLIGLLAGTGLGISLILYALIRELRPEFVPVARQRAGFFFGDDMKIKGHKISDVPFKEAHAYGGEMKPTGVCLHDTAGRLDRGSSVDWFASDDCPNSAHVVIERDGSITQMVPFNRKAWHCGPSSFHGKAGCNSFLIGIEIVNPGILDKNGRAWFHKINKDPKKWERGYDVKGLQHVKTKEHGDGWWMPYTQEQIEAVTSLLKAICGSYPDVVDVTTHWAISPGRKIDTNPLFPVEEVRRAALGIRGEEEVAAIEPLSQAATADVSASDLISRTIRDANALKVIGGTVATGAAAKGVHEANVPVAPPAAPPVALPSLQDVSDQLTLSQKIMEGIGDATKFAVDHYWIVGIVAGFALWYYGRRIIHWYLEDIRTGKREPVFKITKKLVG